MSKILTVFGATGNQGGSVIKNILEHPELSKAYKLRAVTRDVTKSSATALKDKGVEVVSADMNDKPSLVKAIQGSSLVFGVTNFWEGMDEDAETTQGKNLVDACKESRVDRLIFSSLPYVSKETHGKLTSVKHFDSKAKVEEYARAQGVPATYVLLGPFMSFMVGTFRKQDSGVYVWAVPFPPDKTQLPVFDAAGDTGLFVAAILLNLDETLDKRVLLTSGYKTPDQLAADLSEATGVKAATQQISYETFKSFLPPASAEELTANFQLMENPGYFVGEPSDAVDWSLGLVSKSGLRKPTDFKAFAKQNFQK